MPAWLHQGDLVGLKWVAAFPDNRRHGLAAINGLVVLNDAETGVPTWIMDAARITAVRTAAVSGVALRLLMPRDVETVALVGAGVQGQAHSEVMRALVPHAELVTVSTTAAARDAVGRAQVVVTMAPLGAETQVMTPDWLGDGTLVIAVDFATYASAALARDVGTFVVDDRAQFLAYRDAGYFDDYPDPAATMGELLDRPAQAHRSALVTHLGVGLADVFIADAVARRAAATGLGTELAR
jgi:ornithine cyclodeaminase/alanine dehydrogenase-like protein (mu-crystallin family)